MPRGVYVRTPEMNRRNSESKIGVSKKPYPRKPHSEETRAKIGESQRGVARKDGRSYLEHYGRWKSMVHRCYSLGSSQYEDYGGRGIGVAEEWREDPFAFDAWIRQELGPRPSPGHSLDRIDNDADYEPGNLRWATHQQQMANRRPRSEWRTE